MVLRSAEPAGCQALKELQGFPFNPLCPSNRQGLEVAMQWDTEWREGCQDAPEEANQTLNQVWDGTVQSDCPGSFLLTFSSEWGSVL